MISDRWRRGSCWQVCKLVSSRSHTAPIVVGRNRKPPSPIKYDGLTRTVLEKVFRPVYYRWKRRSVIYVRNLAGGNVVVSMTKLSFCYTQALQILSCKLPEILPYHLKKRQNPYWIRTIRTMWHVWLRLLDKVQFIAWHGK